MSTVTWAWGSLRSYVLVLLPRPVTAAVRPWPLSLSGDLNLLDGLPESFAVVLVVFRDFLTAHNVSFGLEGVGVESVSSPAGPAIGVLFGFGGWLSLFLLRERLDVQTGDLVILLGNDRADKALFRSFVVICVRECSRVFIFLDGFSETA